MFNCCCFEMRKINKTFCQMFLQQREWKKCWIVNEFVKKQTAEISSQTHARWRWMKPINFNNVMNHFPHKHKTAMIEIMCREASKCHWESFFRPLLCSHFHETKFISCPSSRFDFMLHGRLRGDWIKFIRNEFKIFLSPSARRDF